ncbi:MAG: hypothetical protein JST12_08770 [Armatimonadetes bacterium]|nr:hypothetical protein [Armatimonadota bacterium]MBS1728711.1 hypothetical protein [Armatimonadota bacterium]
MGSSTISISTSSQVINYATPLPPATLPTITIDGTPLAAPNNPYSPTGYQVVIFNSTKPVTDPTALLANVAFGVGNDPGTNSWWNTYQYVYSNMLSLILNTGNIDEQFLLIVSFGLDNNMPPTNDMLSTMLNLGANGQLQKWETTCDPGSQVGNANSWVSYPASYILVGSSGWGYGEGEEAYQNTAGPLSLNYSF